MIEPHPSSCRWTSGARALAVCVALLAWSLVPAARAQQGQAPDAGGVPPTGADPAQGSTDGPRAEPGGDPTAAPPDPRAEALEAALERARTDLRGSEADAAQRAVALKTLLDAGELAMLRELLGGPDEGAALALLRALAVQPPAAAEPLAADVLALGARRPGTEVASAADALLGGLSFARPTVLALLQADLLSPDASPERRRAALRALGRSRSLSAVDTLIAALDTADAAVARDALVRLTGHDLGAQAGSQAWAAWWQAHRSLGRDQLLELAREVDRRQFEQQRAALEQEVIKVRLDTMGHDDVARLVGGLSDMFAAVRLEAVRRLARHTNPGQAAASAVPVMLRRLGHPVTGGAAPAAGNGAAGPEAPAVPEDKVVLETDATVRVALVEALGTLGRSRDDVRAALVGELRGAEAPVVAAAAAGLRTVRDQPSVVEPLLDDLDRRPGEQGTFETLQAVAANRPAGVIPRLVPWLGPEQSARVRGAAVRALVASENIGQALDHLEQLYAGGDTPPDVRFAMAAALGARVPQLSGTPAWERSIRLLTSLLDSGEPNVRAEAVAALGRTASREALDLLDARSRNETDPEVVRRIVDAIGMLRLPQGGGVIGRVVASRKELRGELEPVARESLTLIAGQGGPADWLSLGEAVGGAGAHSLACWCYRELISRYEAAPENKDAIDRARGRLASDLYLSGQAGEALSLLLALEAEQAPYPSPLERMDLLARASEELGRFSEAADYHLRRFAMLPPGELQRTATRKAAVSALRKAGRYADALGHLRELVREDGGDNHLLFDLARTEEASGQLPQAKVDLERLLERIPASETAFRQDVDTVLQRVLRALEGKPPPEVVPAERPVGTPGAGAGPGSGHGDDGGEPAPAGPDAGGEPPDGGASGGAESVSPAIRVAPAA